MEIWMLKADARCLDELEVGLKGLEEG